MNKSEPVTVVQEVLAVVDVVLIDSVVRPSLVPDVVGISNRGILAI